MTDQGRQRHGNEDRFGVHPAVGLFIVADGMGGHCAGEVAAQMAVDLVFEGIVDTDVTWPRGMAQPAELELPRLVAAIERANHCIHGASQRNRAWTGMGTTIAAALVCGDRVALAHVGDSRIYRLHGRRLALMTEDHSLFNLLVHLGRVDPEKADEFEQRNIITRALGIDPKVDVDACLVNVAPGDTFLLCSDGLSGPVPQSDLVDILLESPNVDDAARRLVSRANELGGPDNVTAVVVRWELPGRLPPGRGRE